MFSTFCKLVGRPTCLIRRLDSLRFTSTSYDRERYLKRKSDLEKWQAELLRNSKNKRRRYIEDSDYRNRTNSESRARLKKQRDTDESSRRIKTVDRWIRRYTWFREQLPWNCNHPVLYPDKFVRSCSRCGVTRRDGLKIWWESLESENHICHNCYTKADWDEVLPQGYEDCRTQKDLVARMQQLGTWTKQGK